MSDAIGFWEVTLSRLRDPRPGERVWGLEDIGLYRYRSAFDHVAACLNDNASSVRRQACRALERLVRVREEAAKARSVALMAVRLTDPDEAVRRAVREVWRSWGIGTVVCTLGGPEGATRDAETANVRWLPQSGLFDFDSVNVVEGDYSLVERFCVQVKNDRDPTHRYKDMPCRVSWRRDDDRYLPTNRILEGTFGGVEYVDRRSDTDG